ncbi:uncharacterized protein AKAW2_50103S [Aspergillus luchuensis]|uniref:Uncharacterized protein n=1 Tax=Aspergillus kawachii TaxID=1069201 RepID=A0A7R7WB66_ASPKA|nr:uncharacterized protein AKAW2_50103S [Aspergillus luchuensis]BCR99761.1 hypothetical protein AKAW2_50103S [Aspergillus luchuensis]
MYFLMYCKPPGFLKQDYTSPPSPPRPPRTLHQGIDRPDGKIYVIDAETDCGIWDITEYHSISRISLGFVFRARFRDDPKPIRLIFCPLRIDATGLHQADRERLQACVDSMKLLVPKEAWEKLRVDPEDGLIVFGEEGTPSKIV